MSLREIVRFYCALGSVPALHRQLASTARGRGPSAADQAILDAARGGGFDVEPSDLVAYRRLRPQVLGTKALHDRIEGDARWRAERDRLAGGRPGRASVEALVNAYATLAQQLGMAFDAVAMRQVLDAENLLARPTAQSRTRLRADDLQVSAGTFSLQRVEQALRGNIVQTYPATEYDFQPNR